MQINPVHALLNLIRLEAAQGRSGQLKKQQIEALAELLAQGNVRELGSTKLEKLRLDSRLEGLVTSPPGDEAPKEEQVRSFGPHLASATSDAINQAKHQLNGRGWNYTSENDNAKMALRGDASFEISPESRPIIGVALPFTPTTQDIERALRTGQGWPEEWGEALRLRILHQKPAPQAETPFSLGFRIALAIMMMALAYVMFR